MLAVGSCVALSPWQASAQSPPPGFEGRWVQESRHCEGAQCRRVYDFTACGGGWCGVEVKEGGECGPLAFRLGAAAGDGPGTELSGRYERAPGAEAYTVRARLRPAFPQESQLGSLRLVVVGNSGTSFEPFRRTFPLHMVLQREGDAVCRATSGIS